MPTDGNNHYRDSLRQLAEGYATIITQYERTIALLKAEQARASGGLRFPLPRVPRTSGALRIDEDTLSVIFRSKPCFLGNTIQLRLFRYLLRRRNQYVGHAELLEQVWDGIVSPSTIRSAIKVLRRQLRQAGMDAVADAVVGHVAGHYCLMVDRL